MAVDGPEGCITVQVEGVVIGREHGVGLDPVLYGCPLGSLHIDNIVIVSRGDVVRPTYDCKHHQ